MTHPLPADWLGLCLATESNLPHEWGPISWVIRNRAGHKRWPNTIRDVILQPMQFSHFNPFLKEGVKWRDDEELYEAVAEGRENYGRKIDPSLLGNATGAAHAFLEKPPWEAPFGPKVCFYYSPISMSPKGKMPWWWGKEVKRTITLPGIDPFRFQWGEMG